MPIETLEDLSTQNIGDIIPGSEVSIDFVPERKIKQGKWSVATRGHQFAVGDVFIVADVPKEISGFKNYIRNNFKLSVGVLQKDGKAYCQVRDIKKVVKRKKRTTVKRTPRVEV